MTIEHLRCEHVASVAAIHRAELTGLLSDLGDFPIRAYYQACVDEPLATVLVAADGGRVLGFIAGSIDPEALRNHIRKEGRFRLAASIALGALRCPRTIAWMAVKLFDRAAPPFNASAPELTYLAVREKKRGIGRLLVEAFTAEWAARGTRRFELSVDRDNRSAIDFYERLGFERVGEYREFGRLHFRYSRDTGGQK